MQKNSLLGEYDLKSVYFYILKKYFRKNRENIITCMLRSIIAAIGVLGYFIIANNYVHQKICMKSNSFMWVSLLWFVLTILLCFRVQIMHRHFTKRRKLTWIYALIVPLVSLYMEEKIWNLAIKELSHNSVAAYNNKVAADICYGFFSLLYLWDYQLLCTGI